MTKATSAPLPQIIPVATAPIDGFEAAKKFFAAYPPPKVAGDAPTLVKVSDFDAWAVHNGYMPRACEQATRIQKRNTLKAAIHAAGLSQQWRTAGYTACTLKTTVVDTYLAVDHAYTVFMAMAAAFADDILQVTQTKKRNVLKPFKAIDTTQLSMSDLEQLIKAETQVKSIFANVEFVTKISMSMVSQVMMGMSQNIKQQLKMPTPGMSGDPIYGSDDDEEVVPDTTDEDEE